MAGHGSAVLQGVTSGHLVTEAVDHRAGHHAADGRVVLVLIAEVHEIR